MTTYSLGSSDPEIARLELQAELLRTPTRALLQAAGVAPGMRVLDLGTGLGHVATAVADLVGPSGEVVGIDVDPRMLDVARARTGDLPHVRLVEADVTRWQDAEPFDAVVGRLILFHLPDPVGVLRHHQQALRPGGLVVALDYDISGLRAEPGNADVARMAELVIAAFRAAGADPTIGARLTGILSASGLEEVDGFATSDYLASDDPVGPALLEGVVRSLLRVIVGHGLATEAELDLDTLAARAAASLQSTRSVLVPPTLAGAWGRRPG